jgi:hypothetical protein
MAAYLIEGDISVLNPFRTLGSIAKTLPPEAAKEMKRQIFVSQLAIGATVAAVFALLGIAYLLQNEPGVAIVLLGLLFAGFIYACWRSRKRHLAYEAMLKAERESEERAEDVS